MTNVFTLFYTYDTRNIFILCKSLQTWSVLQDKKREYYMHTHKLKTQMQLPFNLFVYLAKFLWQEAHIVTQPVCKDSFSSTLEQPDPLFSKFFGTRHHCNSSFLWKNKQWRDGKGLKRNVVSHAHKYVSYKWLELYRYTKKNINQKQ